MHWEIDLTYSSFKYCWKGFTEAFILLHIYEVKHRCLVPVHLVTVQWGLGQDFMHAGCVFFYIKIIHPCLYGSRTEAQLCFHKEWKQSIVQRVGLSFTGTSRGLTPGVMHKYSCPQSTVCLAGGTILFRAQTRLSKLRRGWHVNVSQWMI